MERVRPGDVLLDEVVVVFATAMSSPAFETMRPRSIGYSSGSDEADELVVATVVREVESGRERHRLERDLPRALELLDERPQLARPGAR